MKIKTLSQEQAIKMGRDYWENLFEQVSANRDTAIRNLMTDTAGMEPEPVLEDFATLQIDTFIRGLREWIDETFTNNNAMTPKNFTCCSCHNPIVGSPNWVKMDVPATWLAPQWGSFRTGRTGLAVALICDSCNELDTVTIDHVTEFGKDGEILHPLEPVVEVNLRR